MVSSEQQLNTLATISQTQDQLKATADSTIEQLETGRQQIASDQHKLRQAHQIMNSQVLRNLQHIQQEREVIVAGNERLIAKTEQIQQKLDTTAEQVGEQAEVQSARHKDLIHDLAQLAVQTDDVSSKLDASAAVVENFQRSVIENQVDAVENLKRINDTVNFLLSLLNSVRGVVEEKLDWVLLVTGATESRMAVMSVLAAHISFAMFSLILSALLRARRHIRYLLLAVILVNAAAELKFNSGFESTKLAAALLLASLVASFTAWFWAILFHHSPSDESIAEHKSDNNATHRHRLSSEDVQYVIKALEQLSADFTRMSGPEEQDNVDIASVCSSTPIRRLSELGVTSSSSQKQEAEFPLSRTPPPIGRHLLPATPHNPPPSPFANEGSLMNDSGIRRLQQLESLNRNWSSSPTGSGSLPSTPRQKKSRASLNRSFNRSMCTAVTKSGQACKLPSQDGSILCHRHQLS